ncbi:DNA polymerase I [Capnocytophaga catalasegens]|uniref:DNA polymerase I n=1 Tax=Capnocytophaga catalasegens TaxID=1004260 RepID=A0AAV5AZE6_9FLAO|nr:DNA polymerase I [Capnocytophaga catalasegens]GIZ14002.1 DNA polymerase I [Capnocytophaga catalasegens]GJM51113.1 DNA polymerase I [Capnocytophaga catalasegens]GJM54078.1 DNA polymerase I [Capnocytophaga catalasegens]
MNGKKLFLLDAYALIFRGYYAFIKNPRITSKGLNTSAIMGFMNSLLDVIKRENPDHIAVAFDKGGSHARTELFTEYKANRDETPEAIRLAIPYIHQILNAMQIPIIEKEGYEADDIIGTLAKQAENKGYQVYMVTPDKDFGQLVSENIFIYRPAKSGKDAEIWGVEEIKEKFGIENPEQVIDFLGMMGDAVDNIPGLPGVGEKTAQKLLQEFGSLENLLANTDKLKGKLRENIENNASKGILSKQLARIMLDVPVEFCEEDFAISPPKMEEIVPIFEELEFRTLLGSLQKIYQQQKNTLPTEPNTLFSQPTQHTLFDITEISEYKTIKDIPHMYQLVNSPMGIHLLVDQLLKQQEVCFDTETTSLDELNAQLIGISFSWQKNKGYYVSFPENQQATKDLLEKLRPFFENENISKIGQNLKYDIKILANYGIKVKGQLFDTMIAHYLLNPDMRHNMDALAENYLKYSPISIETLIGKKGKNQLSMRNIPLEEQKEYAVEDADITLQLKEVFAPKLIEQNAKKLFEQVETPLVQVLASMELEGIRIDVDFLKTLSVEIQKDITRLESEIYQQAGVVFNLSSPKQLGDILFDKLKLLAKPTKTKTGQYATSEAILSDLAPQHPIVANVLEFRQLQKLQNTYIDALPSEVNPKTGRVHTTYMQAVTATGRLSSNNPNLQNIPIRTPRGQQIRKAFIPRNEQYTLLAADYSQIELRVIAALSGEQNMIDAFMRGEDIHRSTAAKVFNVPLQEVTREQRSHAKTINFGIIYGVSATGLSQQTNLSRSESKNLIDIYYQTYPKLKDYIDRQIYFARQHGYVETILGRRRYLPDINSRNQVVKGAAERNAVNAPIQGSAADIIKIAMINIHRALQQTNYKTKMLLQVHDELIFDVYNLEKDLVVPLIKDQMQNAYQLSVPLIVDVGLGNNWLEAH